MSDFAQYQKMKQELSDELSKNFHQLLMDNLNATNSARKENLESEKRLGVQIDRVDKKLDQTNRDVAPMLSIFNNFDGAFNVSKWIFLALAAIGAGLGGLYLIIQEIRKFWITH